MQLGSESQIPDGLLAANALLGDNSHQGVPTSTHALYQGFGFVISNTALGLKGSLYDEGVGSRYTGKERDAESGLNNFGARYYGSNMGRFMSPDYIAGEDGADPIPCAEYEVPANPVTCPDRFSLIVLTVPSIAISILSGRYQPGVTAAGISRKPGTLDQSG